MKKAWLFAIGGIIIVFAIGVAWFFFQHRASAPQPAEFQSPFVENNSATTSHSTNVGTSSPSRSAPILPSIAKGDTIASWNFNGAYTDNPELVAKAEAEIKRFSDLIGKGTYPDMDLYVSIANQYELLGNGKREYDFLSRAIGVGGTTTGLPWHNLGVLMERLDALQTARMAYEKATLVQPELKQWHYAYLAFLTSYMKGDAADIEKAFAAAEKNIGQDSDILQLYSEWKQS